MTLTERAREIVVGVTGVTVQEWKAGDEEFVRQKLEALLEEVSKRVCPLCGRGVARKDRPPPFRCGDASSVSHYWFHDTDAGMTYCFATPVLKMMLET